LWLSDTCWVYLGGGGIRGEVNMINRLICAIKEKKVKYVCVAHDINLQGERVGDGNGEGNWLKCCFRVRDKKKKKLGGNIGYSNDQKRNMAKEECWRGEE